MVKHIPLLRAVVASALGIEVKDVTVDDCAAALLLSDEELLTASKKKDAAWVRGGILAVKQWLESTNPSD